MAFEFGNTSKERLATASDDLQLIFYTDIETSEVDYGIAEGARTFEKQVEYFEKGASTLDPRKPGVLKKAKHVLTKKRRKSKAVDIYLWHPDRLTRDELRFDMPTFCYVAGHIMATSHRLFKEGKTSCILIWGGNWDRDGTLLQDQTFHDAPHFEEYIPKFNKTR